jgi:hypothetical protein
MARVSTAELLNVGRTFKVGDRVSVTWSVTLGGEHHEWKGTVRTMSENGRGTIVYDGQGPDAYDFPPDENEVFVFDAKLTSKNVKPSMKRTVELTTATSFDEHTISSWGPLLRDRTGVMLLIDRVKSRAGMYPPPNLTSKEGMARARQTHFFEKETIVAALEAWALSVLNEPDFDRPPKSNVPQVLTRRLFVFEVAEREGGSIQKGMDHLRSTDLPKDLQEIRKACLKGAPKNE